MKFHIEGVEDPVHVTGNDAVQTSAQPAAEVVHETPAVGGSYIRNPDTGALTKQEPAEQPEQE